MQDIIIHAILSIISTIVAAYMQIKGIGGPEVVAAVAAVAGGNGAVALKSAVQVKNANDYKDYDANKLKQ